MAEPDSAWPSLPLDEWRDTYITLHMWTQIVGKIRMSMTPRMNHWWNVTLYVTSRGLTTSPIPCPLGTFEVEFDFLEHNLELLTSWGSRDTLPLIPEPVAVFYEKLIAHLGRLGVHASINTKPQEVQNPIPFEQDYGHAAYDRGPAQRFWRILASTATVLQEFRSKFFGKCSPVHFFWGSFDLACTRFSGRPAPPRKGVITAEAYSAECMSAGFWPGMGLGAPAFYAYSAPSPAGLEREPIRPKEAGWNPQLSEFIFMYDEVRRAQSPRDALLDFFQSSYEAGAKLANWDRRALQYGERSTYARNL